MTETRNLHVFLCHSSQDKPIVRELYQRLLAEGWIDPWLDEEKLLPGQDWDMEIEKAVETTDAVVVCLSNNSVTKEGYIQKELRKILDKALKVPDGTIFIIPLRLDECKPPPKLKIWQYIDYFPKEKESRALERIFISLRRRANALYPEFETAIESKSSLLTQSKASVPKSREFALEKGKVHGNRAHYEEFKKFYESLTPEDRQRIGDVKDILVKQILGYGTFFESWNKAFAKEGDIENSVRITKLLRESSFLKGKSISFWHLRPPLTVPQLYAIWLVYRYEASYGGQKWSLDLDSIGPPAFGLNWWDSPWNDVLLYICRIAGRKVTSNIVGGLLDIQGKNKENHLSAVKLAVRIVGSGSPIDNKTLGYMLEMVMKIGIGVVEIRYGEEEEE